MAAVSKPERKRKRWDQQTPSHDEEGVPKKKSAWDQAEVCPLSLPQLLTFTLPLLQSTPSVSHWDVTPSHVKGSETPGASTTPSTRLKWDATPGQSTPGHATPATPGKRNRWDLTPKWNATPRADSGTGMRHNRVFVSFIISLFHSRGNSQSYRLG